MRTTRRDAMIVPDSQQCQHACRKGAMHSQMGAHNAMPVLHDTTGSNRLVPSFKELTCDGTPGRSQSVQQRFHIRPKDRSALPRPGNDLHRLTAQRLSRLVMPVLKRMGKVQQGWQGQLHLSCEKMQIRLQVRGSLLFELEEQA